MEDLQNKPGGINDNFQQAYEEVLLESKKITLATVKSVLKKMGIDLSNEDLVVGTDTITFWNKLASKGDKFMGALAQKSPGTKIRGTKGAGGQVIVHFKDHGASFNTTRNLIQRNID